MSDLTLYEKEGVIVGLSDEEGTVFHMADALGATPVSLFRSDDLQETYDDLCYAAAYLSDLPADPAFSSAYKRLIAARDRLAALTSAEKAA